MTSSFGSIMCILTYNGGQNVQTFQKIDPLAMTSVIYYADHNRDFRMKKKSFLYMYVYRQHVFESMLYECVKRRIKYSSCQVKHFFLFSSSAKKGASKKRGNFHLDLFLFILQSWPSHCIESRSWFSK